MPKADAVTMSRFASLVPKDPGVTMRPMFGQRAAFVHGRMFAGTFGLDIVVRLPEEERRELLAVDGARTFEPMKGRPMTEFVVLPRQLGTSDRQALTWIRRAFVWTAQLPPKTPTKKAVPPRPRRPARP